MYKVEISENALKQLRKLDKQIARLIIAWITKHLEGCKNSRLLGRELVADKKGVWRYRVGDYRILTHISQNKLIVLVVDVGHRKDIDQK